MWYKLPVPTNSSISGWLNSPVTDYKHTHTSYSNHCIAHNLITEVP